MEALVGGRNTAQATRRVKKRKAESQDNDRLSKRLSLLNLERNGQRLYVPVEQPSTSTTPPSKSKPKTRSQTQNDDIMQLDDTKHKVYIYDLDAELSDSESSDDGKLVFLPDIEKHLRQSRIPPSVMANSEGELAGNSQLVLYNVPSSLTVPEAQDSVRKAILETRARARAKQEEKRITETRNAQVTIAVANGVDARDWYNGMNNGLVPAGQHTMEEDPDAMDLG